MIQDIMSRFRARLSHHSNSPKSSKNFCKYYHPSTTVAGLKYMFITLNCIFLLVTLTTPLTNCQKYPTTNCNQQNQQQQLPPPQQAEHLNPYLHHRDPLQASRQQRQFNVRSGSLLHQKASSQQQLAQLQLQQQQQQLGEQVSKQSMPQTEVEHEEFSLALGLTNNQQQANSNYTLLPASSQHKLVPQLQVSNQTDFFAPKETTSQAPQEAMVSVLNTTPAIPSDSIGSPVALQPPLTTTSSIPSNLANDNKVNIHSAGPSLQAPTSTSTSTTTTTSSTTTISSTNLETQNQTTSLPALSSQLEEINNGKNVINSKQARQDQQLQPNQQHSTRQGHQVGNNLIGEETATAQARAMTQDLEPARAINSIDQFQARQTSSLSGDFMSSSQASGNNNNHHHTQAQFQVGQSNRHSLMDSLPQAMSSSPSSISIITPLIGPPNQQQQQQSNSHTTSVTASIGSAGLDSQQSAMMKPIFVVGNPITERDYNSNSLYYHQFQQPKLDQSYGGQIQPQQQQQQQHQGHHESINKLSVSKSDLEHGQQVDSSPVSSHNLPQQINNKTQMPQKPAESATVSSSSSQNNQQHQSSLPSPSPSPSQPPSLSPSPQPQQLVTQANSDKQARIDKSSESNEVLNTSGANGDIMSTINTTSSYSQYGGIDRMSGPPLIYSDGQLSSVVVNQLQNQQQAEQQASVGPNLIVGLNQQQQQQHGIQTNNTSSLSLQPPSPRLFQGPSIGGAAVLGNNPRRPSLPPPVNQANAASGFRSPMSSSGPLVGTVTQQALQQTSPQQQQQTNSLQQPVNSLMGNTASFYQNSPPYAGASNIMSPLGGLNSIYNNNNNIPAQPLTLGYNRNNIPQASPSQTSLAAPLQQPQIQPQQQQQQQQLQQLPTSQVNLPQSSVVPTPAPGTAPGSGYSGRRPLNITRVEHISAECSNDLIRAVIVFNGTFKGIIYSSGYVTDPTCLYVNGTGSTRYEFNIRLNQCGTLGRQEVHQPTIPGEARRRDQVMWNTLSIQYNSIIEQEWDEHFRVSCEYGSDFWKTVSFSPFNVETNTGSPVVFTINPPQCQMDVLLGHGMGPKIAVDGPVTVGDPLTLLIHMKSEKAGYDILVKNCVAHNGGKQRMQLIDSNGCVVNERFISPFRGTYNDNDLRHVTLYAYLKAFRFTGSPVLYLECEIHMCQSACPPQMCYWRRLSKRSVDEFDYEYTTNSSSSSSGSVLKNQDNEQLPQQPVISDSLNLFKALQVRQESEPMRVRRQMRDIYAEDDKAALICYRNTEVLIFSATIGALFLLLITIAVTCWLRIRSLTKSQFQHNRLATTSSLSPSLLSINEAISSASSIISGAANGSLLNLSSKTCQSPSSWYFQHQHQPHPHQQHHNTRHNHLCHQQKKPPKSSGLLIQRQQQPNETILPVFHGRPNGFTPPISR